MVTDGLHAFQALEGGLLSNAYIVLSIVTLFLVYISV